MKPSSHLFLYLFAFITAVSCNTTPLTDAIDNFAVVIELPEIETEVSFQIVDATTGELIQQPVDIIFFGDRNGNNPMIDMYSDEITEFTTSSGFMNVGVQNGTSVSESSPVVVGLTVKAQGYKDQTTSFEIQSSGQNFVVLEMIPLNNPPIGLSIVREMLPNTASGGVLTDSISFSASETTGALTPRIGFNLPEGTLLKDANGTPLSGQLEIEVVMYNPSVPGATALANPTLMKTNEDSARIIYGLWETKLMDQSGRVATSMEIPAEKRKGTCVGPYGTVTTGFSTGCAKRLPDMMAASAFDNPLFQNQLWWFGTPNPTPPPSVITYEFAPLASLPSWTQPMYGWLSDFEFEACVLGTMTVNSGPTCSGGSPSNSHMISQQTEAKDIVVEIDRNGHTSPLSVTLTSEGGYSKTVQLTDGSTATFTQTHAPLTEEDYLVEVQISAISGDPTSKVIDRSEYETGRVSVQLPRAEAALIDASLKVNLVCGDPESNPTLTDIPTASLYYRPSESETGEMWRAASDITFTVSSPVKYITGGTALLKGVVASKNYTMKLVYNDEVIERDVLVTGTQVEYTDTLPDDICQ